ncbi:MAG TPA: hypothetical protein VEO01_34825 [Pseudonocardiaceae bacterium]|nr:hypothetical protein [Pseudonocardiaceae bacterium]
MDGDPAGRDAMERILAAAAEVVRRHVPNRYGVCVGCSELGGRLVFIEYCGQRQWAEAVRAAYARPAE